MLLLSLFRVLSVRLIFSFVSVFQSSKSSTMRTVTLFDKRGVFYTQYEIEVIIPKGFTERWHILQTHKGSVELRSSNQEVSQWMSEWVAYLALALVHTWDVWARGESVGWYLTNTHTTSKTWMRIILRTTSCALMNLNTLDMTNWSPIPTPSMTLYNNQLSWQYTLICSHLKLPNPFLSPINPELGIYLWDTALNWL